MIRKTRIRFSLIIVLAVFVVLSIIIGSINFINYTNVANNADDILEILASNDGAFVSKPNDFDEEFSPELPFETRYFTVEVYSVPDSGVDDIFFTNIENIAAVTEGEAVAMTKGIIDSESKNGFSGNYRYMAIEKEISTLVIYVDWSRQLEVVQNFLIASIVISFISIVCLFFIAYLLSEKALAPIIKSYQKQSRFIANASHELKTPLTIISANSEIIEIENGESESTQAIFKQVNKLNKMVNSLTLLSKIEKFKKKKETDSFNLSKLLNDAIKDYNFALDKYTLKLNIEEDIEYYGVDGLIAQMFSILLENAAKYSLSTIDISLMRNNKKIEIIFKNDVAEIEQGNLKKYFERFYRSSDVRSTKIEGSGIGLSICSEIVEFHKGSIKAFGEDNNFIIKITL